LLPPNIAATGDRVKDIERLLDETVQLLMVPHGVKVKTAHSPFSFGPMVWH
jgi:hypothetical protein